MTPEKISIVTPTYRRHTQLRRMLDALSTQTVAVGQIIIADGGRDAGELVAEYADVLPVVWVDCTVRGQIAQRNHALGLLSERSEVVIYMDDDIVLAPDCIETLVKFWNEQKAAPAGVGMNITNMPEQRDNFARHVFVMQSRPFGKVLKSGYNTPVTGVTENIEVQWLTGGATAWRRDILEAHANRPVETSWAVGEDLMFSYPVGKREKLLVCAAALCVHEDEAPVLNFPSGRFRAYRGVVSRFVFVRQHDELSRGLFVWMIFGQALGRVARALMGRPGEWGALVGTVEALMGCLRHFASQNPEVLLADKK